MKIRVMVIAMLGMGYAANMQGMKRPFSSVEEPQELELQSVQPPLWEEYMSKANKIRARRLGQRYYYNAETRQREALPIERLNENQIKELIKDEQKNLKLAQELLEQSSSEYDEPVLGVIYERLGDMAYDRNDYTQALAMYIMAIKCFTKIAEERPEDQAIQERWQRLNSKKEVALENRRSAVLIERR